MRKCENIFAGYSVPKFQVYFLVQAKIEGKGNCKTAILRASEHLRWLRIFSHLKENTMIPYRT